MSKATLHIENAKDQVTLSAGRTEVQLARANGCILEVRDKGTGRVHCSVADQPALARLFRVIAMRRRERGRAADAHLQSETVWSCDDNGVTITHPALRFEGQPAACSAVTRIEAGADDELRFRMTIENRGDDPVHEIQFPMLPGWRNREGAAPIALTAGAKWRSEVGLLPQFGPPAYCQWYQQVAADYPGGGMYMPWLDGSTEGGGLSMINYMERPYTGGVGGINLAGHEKGSCECYWWRHYPLIRKGGRWESPPVGIAVHAGDWHCTADRYYDWFRSTVGVTIEPPRSLRTAIGFQNIVLRNFDGTPHNAPETLPEHARAGQQYGVEHLAVWDAMSLGNYAIHDPDLDLFDYTDDEGAALREAIRRARELGVTVSALSDFRHINVTSALYPRYRAEAVLAMDGSEQRENWMGGARTSKIFTPHLGGNSIVLSPRSPETRKRFDALLDRYLALGYNAIFYDQPFLYQLDYNHMGADNRPDDACTACYDHVEHVRDRVRQVNAEAYLIGEQFDIFSASRAIDLHMEWLFGNQVEDLARMHYACPHALLSYVIDYLNTDETHASRAFAAGLLLCLTLDGGEANLGKRPALAAHIASLAALRKRCAERLVFGRFRHTVGLTIAGDADVCAYAYDSPAGPAVALAAGAQGGTAKVVIDPSRFQTPAVREPGRLYLLDGEVLPAKATRALEHTLAPHQVAVWYL